MCSDAQHSLRTRACHSRVLPQTTFVCMWERAEASHVCLHRHALWILLLGFVTVYCNYLLNVLLVPPDYRISGRNCQADISCPSGTRRVAWSLAWYVCGDKMKPRRSLGSINHVRNGDVGARSGCENKLPPVPLPRSDLWGGMCIVLSKHYLCTVLRQHHHADLASPGMKGMNKNLL